MSRSQEKKVYKSGLALSEEEKANAQQAFGGAMGSINDYKGSIAPLQTSVDTFGKDIGAYQDFLNTTYAPGGTFAKNASVMANDVSQANQNALQASLAKNAETTGYNTANYAPTVAESGRQGARDLTSFNAKEQQLAAEELNKGNLNVLGERAKMPIYQNSVTDAYGRVPGYYTSLYGTSLGGSNAALGTAGGAARTPGFWDTMGNGFANWVFKSPSGGGTAASAGAAGAS